MRKFIALSCLSLMSLLTACGGTPTNGYYDANGNFISYNPAHGEHVSRDNFATDPDDRPGRDNRPYYYDAYHYDRAGYYDRNGYYVSMEGGMTVPEDMFPARGMCRVWFPHRDLRDQPAVESCRGIQDRVPAGAYVVYGG